MSPGRFAALALLVAVLISGGVFLSNKLVGSGWATGAGSEEGNLSTDPSFYVGVDAFEPPDEQAMQTEVAAAILQGLHQRGIKPPKGMKYRVEANITRAQGPELSLQLDGRPVKMPSMKLVCTITMKFKDKVLYEKSADILPDQNQMIEMASKRPGTFIHDFDKELWKSVGPAFSSLAESIPNSK